MENANPLTKIGTANLLVLIFSAVITIWFPLTENWSDYHGFVYSVKAPELIYHRLIFKPFFLMPWAMAVVWPFTLIPYQIGWIIFNLLSFVATITLIFKFDKQPNYMTLLICFASFSYALFAFLGQWEGILLGFIAISLIALERKNPWLLGLGLLLMATKPIHMWMVGAIILWQTVGWDFKQQAKIYIIPIVTFLLTFVWRATWIQDYITFLRVTPPQNIHQLDFAGGVSISFPFLNPSIWLIGATLLVFAVYMITVRPPLYLSIAAALCTNLILTNYLQIYHFMLLIPAFILIGSSSRNYRNLITLFVLLMPFYTYFFDGILLIIFPLVTLLLLVFSNLNPDRMTA